MKRTRKPSAGLISKTVLRLAFLSSLILSVVLGKTTAASSCDPLGWFPDDFGIKDHTFFEYGGYTYIAAILLPGEQQFAYARSTDLCTWEVLDPILSERTPGDWDENRIWAPFVYVENGSFYMFYTGVNNTFSQSILLATTSNPADPASWTEQGLMFQPSHSGAIWSPNAWSNNRDPMVFKHGSQYYLLYTGRDLAGGIVGLATAGALTGPWQDLGATVGPIDGRILESPTLFSAWGTEYIVYHNTWLGQSFGAAYRTGPSPLGPWSDPAPFFPGWAHEVWSESGSDWLASYLTGYSVTIRPLDWVHEASPPQPYLGDSLQHIFLPLAVEAP